MGKLIFFLIIIVAVYFLFFKRPKQINSSNSNDTDSNDLIMCEKCKTFTPKEEILNIKGKNICKDCYDNTK